MLSKEALDLFEQFIVGYQVQAVSPNAERIVAMLRSALSEVKAEQEAIALEVV